MKRAITVAVSLLVLIGIASASLAGATISRTGTIVCITSAGTEADCDGKYKSVMLDTLKQGKYILWGDAAVLSSLAKLKDKTGCTITGEVKKGGPYYHDRIIIEKYEAN